MGFGFDLVTKVRSVEQEEDQYMVEIELARGAMVARPIMLMRARARAMVAVGVIEVAGNTSRDIARAIRQMDLDTIRRATEILNREEVLREEADIAVISVNK